MAVMKTGPNSSLPFHIAQAYALAGPQRVKPSVPVEQARAYDEAGADELCFLDDRGFLFIPFFGRDEGRSSH